MSVKLEHLSELRFLVLPSLQVQQSGTFEGLYSIIEPFLSRYRVTDINVNSIEIIHTYRSNSGVYNLNDQYCICRLFQSGNSSIPVLLNIQAGDTVPDSIMPEGIALIEKSLLELHQEMKNECDLFVVDGDNVPSEPTDITDFGYYVLKIVGDVDYSISLNIVKQVDIFKTEEHRRLAEFLHKILELLPNPICLIIIQYCTLV